MIGFDEACGRLFAVARPLGVETVPLEDAWNRVLAAPVTAARSAPSAAVSAMDGYAIRDADIRVGGTRLKVVGEVFAGPKGHELPLKPGSCVRIFTGARLPAGASRVVIQERVERDAQHIRFDACPGEARHVRAEGSDFRAGDTLLAPGTLLSPKALVTAAAADRDTVDVYRKPRVAVLCTGDELVSPGQAGLSPHAVPESVSFGVGALVREWGGDLVGRRRLPDDPSQLQQAADAALDAADLVVVIGGASVGERDYSKAMFAPFGLSFIFDKVAIKPGKPVWAGQARGRIVIGLPGNPSAAMVTARLFLVPLLAGLGGRSPAGALTWRTAASRCDLPRGDRRDGFLRGRHVGAEVQLLADQDSSLQKQLAAADILVRRRPGVEPLAWGEAVEVLDF